MEESTKLKPVDLGSKIVVSIGLSLALIIIFILIGFFWGESTLDKIIATLLVMGCLYDLLIIIRIRNWAYLAHFLWMFFMAVRLFTGTQDKILITIYVIAVFFFAGLYFYLAGTKRIKWRYREILELAARPVNDAGNGFTERPYPSGTVVFSRVDLHGFAKFLRRRQMAFPYFEKNRVVFLVEKNWWAFLLPRINYSRLTHVIFDHSGQITVQISEKSYKKYRDELTFDSLCHSLGQLFAQFMELFRQDQKKQIIQQLNALKFKVKEE